MPPLPGVSLLSDVYDAARALVTLPIDVQRVVRRVDALLDDVEPQLRVVASAVDVDDLSKAVDGLVETQRQVTAIANTTGQIMGVINEVGSRLGSLPGAPLLTRRRAPKTDS